MASGSCHFERSEKSRSEKKGPMRFLAAMKIAGAVAESKGFVASQGYFFMQSGEPEGPWDLRSK